jgi:hypothetical protein
VAIGFRAATGNKNEATGTDVLLTYPAAVASGDAMLLRYSLSGTTVTLVTPSGWTLLAGPIDKGTTNREYLLGRVANGTEAGNTLTISASASSVTKRYAQLAAYSGTDTSPFGTPSSFVETTAGTTHAAPTVNVATANCWIVEFAEDRGSPGSTGLTHGTYTLRDTQVGTGGGAMTVAVADSNTTVAVSTTAGGGTWTGTLSTANAILWTVALLPLATGAPTGLTATPITSSRIDLAWNAVSGAVTYDVERNGVIVASPATNAYSDTGLLPSTLYSYRVRSVS